MISVTCVTPAISEEEVPTTEYAVAFLSQYIWRGQELSRDSLVIQPSMTVAYRGVAANLWGNLDTDPYGSDDSKENWNETDFTLSYGRAFGKISAEVGWIYYGLDGVDDTNEFYASIGLDSFLAPTVTIYRDSASYRHTYFLAEISHAFAVTEAISLELGGSLSYLSSDDKDEYPEFTDQGVAKSEKFDNFHDGVIWASLPIPLGQYFTISPTVSYVFPLTSDAEDEMKARSQKGDEEDFFIGGVVCTMAF